MLLLHGFTFNFTAGLAKQASLFREHIPWSHLCCLPREAEDGQDQIGGQLACLSRQLPSWQTTLHARNVVDDCAAEAEDLVIVSEAKAASTTDYGISEYSYYEYSYGLSNAV